MRLEPLTIEHLEGLSVGAADPDIFRWFAVPMNTPARIREWVEAGLSDQASGQAVPFATIEQSSGTVVGSTRFGSIDRANLRVEIGWTWIMRPWQRTGINREAKYLMLRHAFETWGVRRVELKTNANNAQSRTAMLRLGAVEEGTLRKHMIMADGSPRDSVYFSILDTEWPWVKERLEARA